MPSSLRFAAALLIGAASSLVLASPSSERAAAVAAARQGQYDTALATLRHLVAHNTDPAYRYDLVTVESWAGQHQAATRDGARIPASPRTPDYVLSALARSALLSGAPVRAARLARELLRRHPDDNDARLWLLLARQQRPSADAGRALAELHARVAGRPGDAATVHDLLTQMGQPRRAAEFAPAARPAPATPAPAPSPTETLAAAQQRNAEAIRAAEASLDSDFTPGRYAPIDAALQDNARLIEAARAARQTALLTTLQHDRVVALRDRGHAREALELFQQLDQADPAQPAYVVEAAADARMRLRQPAAARALYQRALAGGAGNALAGRYYAELEMEDFPAFQATARELERHASPRDRALIEARTLRFSDHLDSAETVLRDALQQFPDDPELQRSLAATLATRGRPRDAAALYRQAAHGQPADIPTRVAMVDTELARGAPVETLPELAALAAQAPEHPAVARLLDGRDEARRPLLTSRLTYGNGQGRVSGNQDVNWVTSLYAGLDDNGLRPYVTHTYAHARFDGQDAHHEQAALGMELNRRDVSASLELGRTLDNGQDFVWAARGAWQADDSWRLHAGYESQTNDFPLKGRVPGAEADAPRYLHASRSSLGASYRWNESRRLSLDLNHDDFNDGNQRDAAQLGWTERLREATRHTVDLTTSLYASHNSRDDAYYFNPAHDWSLGFTLSSDWLTWRAYERRFNQRLVLSGGLYDETGMLPDGDGFRSKDYGAKPWGDVRYEHAWQLKDFSATYGLGYNRFPYDGRYENKLYLYLEAGWRF